MNLNKVQVKKVSILDGVELKSATFLDKSFPIHFHSDWSLTLIKTGSENILFKENTFLLNKDSVILIPPYSLHSNWGSKGCFWTYNSIYVNEDVVKSIVKNMNKDYHFFANTPYFVSYVENGFQPNEVSIIKTIKELFLSSTHLERLNNSNTHLDEILIYLTNKSNSKVNLDDLESRFKINKFKLLRNFKKSIGVTPLEYQTSLRIESSKKLFFEKIPLVDIALETGFYDQSHFSHCFKKYVGVTPSQYKSNCNIIQDLQ